MNITVFGGASPKVGDPEYAFAHSLGYRLGSLGHTLITGGYHGIMMAVSQGAREAGAHVLGFTCDEIELRRPVRANEYVVEEQKFKNLSRRMDQLIERCEVAIALPGGIGTLAEIALMWNRLILGSIPRKPLILMGREWKSLLAVFSSETSKYVAKSDYELIKTMDTIEEITSYLDQIIKV